MNAHAREIKALYLKKKKEIDKRILDFRNVWLKGGERDVLQELIFCVFTPQSKAVSCWNCVVSIIENRLLENGTPAQLLKLREINYVRFKNKKAVYACEARDKFMENGKISIKKFLSGFRSPYEMREWLVENIKGYGYKEASHFLRNIGFGEDIAILDRHILKNLKLMGVIARVPESITPNAYFDIENRMKKFAKKIRIPMAALDLILWYREAGHIFK